MKQSSAHRLPVLLTAALVVVLLFVAITSPAERHENDELAPAPPSTQELSVGIARETSTLPVELTLEVAEPDETTAASWNLDDVGARMRIPDGWSVGATDHRRYLARDLEDWHAGSVNQMKVPNLFGLDIDGVLEQNMREFRDNPALEVLNTKKMRINGRDVLRFDYVGTTLDSVAQRVICFTYLWGSQQVAFTWAVREEQWEEIASDVEAAIATMWLKPLKTGSK